uniref:KDM5A_1 protein n=1 Tax=Fopius arisanus TaxID=64838 RepID=A0A0C9R8X8_9HYME
MKLEKCIDFGDSICIELPQLVRLKQKLRQIQWLDEVKSMLDDSKSVTREDLAKLIETGMTIPPHFSIETMLSKLQQLVINIEKWEEKAKGYLQSKSRQNIVMIEEFIQEADNIDAYLPSLDSLQDILTKTKNWTKTVKEVSERDSFPYYDTLEELVKKGRNIPLHLDALPGLESTLSQAKTWKERTARTFLRKNSHYTLMEALSPRIGVGVQALKTKKNKGDEAVGAVFVCDTKLDDSSDSANVVAAFKLAEQREMETMRNLRERNMSKATYEDSRYCVCRRPRFGLMLQCELCKDWFHSNCVPLPKTMYKAKVATTRETKFLCPCCLRSRRPRLETILSLLVSLQKIQIRLPEGEALQCLTERAMNWQDRARQALAIEEISSVLAKLSVLSQKLVEAAAREKTEKIISSELKKAANNPELHQRVQAIAPLSGVHSDDSALSTADDDDEIVAIDGDQPSCSTFNTNEHAYSYVSKFQRKSLSPQNPENLVTLSEGARSKLDELMMEGDLLEVALEETQHIWRILSHTNSPSSVRKYAAFEEVQATFNSDSKDPKKRGRKRKSEEFELLKKMGRQKPVDDKTIIKKKAFNSKDTKKVVTPPGTLKRGPRKIKRKEGEEIPKKRGGNRKKTKQDTSDEEDDCAAGNCLRPSGREVDWVQCDGGCDGWFHMHCVGLDRTELTEEDDYICSNCKDAEQSATVRKVR